MKRPRSCSTHSLSSSLTSVKVNSASIHFKQYLQRNYLEKGIMCRRRLLATWIAVASLKAHFHSYRKWQITTTTRSNAGIASQGLAMTVTKCKSKTLNRTTWLVRSGDQFNTGKCLWLTYSRRAGKRLHRNALKSWMWSCHLVLLELKIKSNGVLLWPI